MKTCDCCKKLSNSEKMRKDCKTFSELIIQVHSQIEAREQEAKSASAGIALCDGVSRARNAYVRLDLDVEEGDIPEIVHESGTLIPSDIDMEPGWTSY